MPRLPLLRLLEDRGQGEGGGETKAAQTEALLLCWPGLEARVNVLCTRHSFKASSVNISLIPVIRNSTDHKISLHFLQNSLSNI